MAMAMLKELAALPLPATFRLPAEVDQIMLLRAAGLVIALTPAPSDPLSLSGKSDAAQVLAITAKGRDELAKFSLPGEEPARLPTKKYSWRSAEDSVSAPRR